MTQLEKLAARLREARGESSLADVRRLLEANGWEIRNQRGSHVTFVRGGELPIGLPLVSGRRVKRVYVRDALARVDEGNAK